MTRCIVTRPAAQAGTWVRALRAAGLDALAFPLITIAPAIDPAPVGAAWRGLNEFDALMFVSANAVTQFLAACPADVPLSQAWTGRRCWVTGPGSAAALRAAGVPESQIDAPAVDVGQFDSEALWSRVAPDWRPGTRVLIVRGDAPEGADGAMASNGVGRDWFAQQVSIHGGFCSFVVAYRRTLPTLSANALALLQVAASDQSVWIFSSSEAVQNLQQLVPAQSWRAARAVATHPRIAAQALALGFGNIHTARPVVADLIASIESLP